MQDWEKEREETGLEEQRTRRTQLHHRYYVAGQTINDCQGEDLIGRQLLIHMCVCSWFFVPLLNVSHAVSSSVCQCRQLALACSLSLTLSLSSLRHLVFMPISMKFLTCLQTAARLQLQLHVLPRHKLCFFFYVVVVVFLLLFACAASAKTGPVPFHDFTLMR